MEQKERKIYLLEIFKYIGVNKIKVIIGSVFIALAFVGCMYILDVKNYSPVDTSGKEIIQEGDLTYDEKKVVDNLILMQDRAEFYENYLEKSYLMNIDVYKAKKVNFSFYVDSEYKFDFTSGNEIDYTTSLLEMYFIYANSAEFQMEVMNGLDEIYVKELFNLLANYETNTLNMSVYVPEIIDSEVVKEQILTLIKEKELETQQYGEHKLVTLTEEVVQEYDNNLENKLYTNRKTISDTKSQVILLKGELNEKQQKYLKEYYGDGEPETEEKPETEEEPQTVEKPKVKGKNIVLGVAFGIFIMCAYYIISSILSGRLQCEDDIRVMFGLNVLGLYTGQNMDEYLVAKIKCICKKMNINQVLVVSSVNEYIKSLDNIICLLKKNDIELIVADSIVCEASSYEKMCEVQNVIIVEKKYVSKYNDIGEELQLITDNNVNVIGSIVMK